MGKCLRATIRLCGDQAPWAAPHYNLGLLLSRKGDLAGAEQEFRRASELRTDDPEAALNWAKSLLCIGRQGEARGALLRARRHAEPGSKLELEASSLLDRQRVPRDKPAFPVRRGV